MKNTVKVVLCFLAGLFVVAVFLKIRNDHNRIANTTVIRAPVDSVGYALVPHQIEEIIRLSGELETDTLKSERESCPDPWIAGIAPHDDHVYAGRVYIHTMQNIKAKRMVLFGVAHKAQNWQVEDRLIFDAYRFWKGPYGNVPVSSLRKKIVRQLDPDQFIVSNDFHAQEHSLEGLLPFLQYYNRNVEIVPILIPYMDWKRMDLLADELALVLGAIIRKNNWRLGEDIAFLISNDCVHYGDEGWSGKNYADFGVDQTGYQKAVKREYELIYAHLTGTVQSEKLKTLLYRLVDMENVHNYRITWCGRFSIPFGLDCLHHLAKKLDRNPLQGHLLRYGTSLNPGRLSVSEDGPGVTAPASLRHWVGYCAIGYR